MEKLLSNRQSALCCIAFFVINRCLLPIMQKGTPWMCPNLIQEVLFKVSINVWFSFEIHWSKDMYSLDSMGKISTQTCTVVSLCSYTHIHVHLRKHTHSGFVNVHMVPLKVDVNVLVSITWQWPRELLTFQIVQLWTLWSWNSVPYVTLDSTEWGSLFHGRLHEDFQLSESTQWHSKDETRTVIMFLTTVFSEERTGIIQGTACRRRT